MRRASWLSNAPKFYRHCLWMTENPVLGSLRSPEAAEVLARGLSARGISNVPLLRSPQNLPRSFAPAQARTDPPAKLRSSLDWELALLRKNRRGKARSSIFQRAKGHK